MELTAFRHSLFAEGEKMGFTDLELSYEKQASFTCNIFRGEVDGYDSSTVQGVSIRGLYGGKTGYAYTEKMDADSISFLLEHAKENATLSETEPESLFSGAKSYEELDLYSPALDEVTTAEEIAFIKEVEKKVYALDSRVIQVDTAAIQDQTTEKALFNNKGLALNERNNFLSVYVSVLVKANDVVKSAYHFERTKDFAALDAEKIAKTTVDKALSYLGGKSYPNKTYPVILKHTAAASLLATFVSSFSAESVQNDQSRLNGKLGEQIASEVVKMEDNPFLPDGVCSTTFDAEGVPTKKCAVVENGKLQTYFHNQKTAKKDGVQSTGHGTKQSYKGTLEVGPSNFFIVPSTVAHEQLYENIAEGIIITDLAGLHSGANPISGDFSLAADGYFVKDGKIAGPTNQMTVAGNFFDLLKDVEQVGSDLEFTPMSMSGYIGSPSLKIGSLAITVE